MTSRPYQLSTFVTFALLLAAPASAMRIAECGDPAFVAKEAALIVQGRVGSVLAKESKDGMINTFVRVKVKRVLKGKAGQHVTLKLPGGVVGDKGVAVSETPNFRPGDKGYFYLAPIEGGPPRYYDAVCGWAVTKDPPPAAALQDADKEKKP